ncbi:MAG: Ig-like domain-containing protein [Longimicrobiales bacterium]|nr:Ig-like domain-containing protein [Longimicrobiales bacterium]
MNRNTRTGWRSRTALPLTAALLATLGACTDTAAIPGVDDVASLLSVQPAGGSVNVAVGRNVVITFDHAIAAGMEAYAALHEGSVVGPVVAGAWGASQDRTVLTFRPAAPLKAATTYVIHLGGGMMGGNGQRVNLERHGIGMGGQWATGSMMTGGMGAGMMSGGQSTMMGSGWQHPNNGSYGMVFTFKTAA